MTLINQRLYCKRFALLLTIILFSQCNDEYDLVNIINNEADDKFDELYGSNIIQGVVLYRDATTNILDTAKDAFIELRKLIPNIEANANTDSLKKDSVNIALRSDLSVNAGNGKFKFSSLPSGSYQLNATYTVASIVYLTKDTINTANSQSIDSARVIELQLDTATDYSLASLSGRVLAENPLATEPLITNGAKLILTGPVGARFSEIDSTTTNTQGIYEFKNLSAGKYNLTVQYERSIGNTIVTYTETIACASDTDTTCITIQKNKSDNRNINLSLPSDTDLKTASVSGRILFLDKLSDLNKVASEVEVHLTNKAGAGFNTIADEGGYFTVNNLAAGNYELSVSYRQNVVGGEQLVYELPGSDLIKVDKEDDKTLADKILEFSGKGLVNNLVKIKVLYSESNARLPNVKVYLFNTEIKGANPSVSLAIDSTETNKRGIALFGNIEGGVDKKEYHIFSRATINNDTLVAKTLVLTDNSPTLHELEVKLE